MTNRRLAGSGKPIGLMLAGRPDLPALRQRTGAGLVSRPDYLVYVDEVGLDPLVLPDTRPFRGMFPWLRDLLRPANLRAVRRMAASHRAILALGEDVGMPLAFVLKLMGSHTPVFFIVHGTYFDNPKFTWLMRALGRSRHVHPLPLSEAVRDTFARRFGWPIERCPVMSGPVDLDFYKPVERVPAEGPPLVVSAGAVRRDYPTLFEAVAPLPVAVQIAVNSAWTSNAAVNEAPPANVTLCTPPIGSGLRDLYAQAAMIVVPLQETDYACGYSTIFEGLAMGRPVIATRTSGQTEMVRDGENGFLVEPGDVAALRERIRYLVEHPVEAARMGRAGRALAEERLGVSVMARNVAAVIAAKTA